MYYIMKISSFFKPLSFLPALAVMYMIYSFSAQPGTDSSSTSYKVSEKIVETVNSISGQGWDEWEIQERAGQINGIVRKGAHVTEYFLLAVSVAFPLYVYGVRGLALMLLAGIICVGYACADEYHQSMVAGRGPSPRDVGIDSIGVLAGIILVRLVGWSGRMAITGPAYERRQKREQEELDRREAELRRREEALRRREWQERNRINHPACSPDAGRLPRSGQAGTERPVRERLPREGHYPSGQSPMPGGDHSPSAPYSASEQPSVNHDRVTDQTRVYRSSQAPDDRTRIFHTQEEAEKIRRDQEARIRREHERNQRRDLSSGRSPEESQPDSPETLYSRRLAEDDTSDQVSPDMPLFSHLGKKRKNK